MNVGGLGGGSLAMEVVATMTGLKEQEVAGQAGTAVLDRILDTQKTVAADLLRTLGVGQNLDLTA